MAMPNLAARAWRKHGHKAADEDSAEQEIAKPGAATNVGGPIARVHIANGDEAARPGKGEDFAKPRGIRRNGNAAVRFGQGGRSEGPAPSAQRNVASERRLDSERFGKQVSHDDINYSELCL